MDFFHCVLCGGVLLCDEGPERSEHRQINGTCILQEDADNLLDNFFVGLGEGGRVVFPFGVLHILPICGFDVGIWLMLRPFGVGVVEPGNLGLDVPKHEGVDFSSNVIPIKVDAQVICARPKMRDGVVRGQDAHEVFGMLLADIFDAEIVNAKGERDGPPLVRPKSWSEFGLCVAFVVEPFF